MQTACTWTTGGVVIIGLMDAAASGLRRRTVPLLLAAMLSMPVSLHAASGSTTGDTTQYESTESSPFEQAALISANAVLVPLAIGVTAIAIVPPSAGMLIEHGTSYATLGFETGIGFGSPTETGKFADERLMVSYAHVYHPLHPDIYRLEAVKDLNLEFLGKRNLLLFGVSPSVGVFAKGSRGYSLGASARLMVPSLPFIGLFPLHTIGITYRYNRYAAGGSFTTIALGISSALIF